MFCLQLPRCASHYALVKSALFDVGSRRATNSACFHGADYAHVAAANFAHVFCGGNAANCACDIVWSVGQIEAFRDTEKCIGKCIGTCRNGPVRVEEGVFGIS